MTPDVSVIIVNYQSKELTRECIKNFKRLPTRLQIELIVVDNGGDAGLADVLGSRFPDVQYVKLTKNLGLSVANNTGARLARAPYLFFSNPDITPLPGSLDTLYAFLESNPTVGMVGPRLLYPDRSIQQSYFRFYTLLTPLFRRTFLGRLPVGRRHLAHFLMHGIDMTRSRDVDLLMGAFLGVRRSAYETVGSMDERFFLYFEDTDWCTRFWQHGMRVSYVPSAGVIHLHERASAHTMGLLSLLNETTRIHLASGIRYFLKHPSHRRLSFSHHGTTSRR